MGSGISIKYDSEADVLLLIFEEKGKLDHAEEVDDIVVHYGDDGRVIMVEILNASKMVSRLVETKGEAIHEEHPGVV